ncbi:hypothetical protein [Psychroserpens algicola]|uniref:hypothetical protein n=1 Tax=Psychroserpens algicola TaxID=1719034 RepID=UPI001954A9A6|nr:hypothetical protein [Psychroserpens algicola]
MNLKTLLKISPVIIVLFFSSCDKRCNREELKVYKAAEEGNLEVVKNYLENGGDLLLDCYDGTSGGKFNVYGVELYIPICKSGSKELVTYYLEQDIPQHIKNDMLHIFLADKNEVLLRVMIENEGRLVYGKECYAMSLSEELLPLTKTDYDFNWIDSNGNTILMNYALCEKVFEGNDAFLETIRFLVENAGVRTDIKNKDGKTAKELAVNPKIKAYLESL